MTYLDYLRSKPRPAQQQREPRKTTCLTCGGAGIVELDNFYMVGPSAREQECRDCFGRGWRTTP